MFPTSMVWGGLKDRDGLFLGERWLFFFHSGEYPINSDALPHFFISLPSYSCPTVPTFSET